MRLLLGSSNLLTYDLPWETLAFSYYFAEQGILMRKIVLCYKDSRKTSWVIWSLISRPKNGRLSYEFERGLIGLLIILTFSVVQKQESYTKGRVIFFGRPRFLFYSGCYWLEGKEDSFKRLDLSEKFVDKAVISRIITPSLSAFINLLWLQRLASPGSVVYTYCKNVQIALSILSVETIIGDSNNKVRKTYGHCGVIRRGIGAGVAVIFQTG